MYVHIHNIKCSDNLCSSSPPFFFPFASGTSQPPEITTVEDETF